MAQVRCPRCGGELYDTVTVQVPVSVQRNGTRLARGRLLQTPLALAEKIRAEQSDIPDGAELRCATRWCGWTGSAASLTGLAGDGERVGTAGSDGEGHRPRRAAG